MGKRFYWLLLVLNVLFISAAEATDKQALSVMHFGKQASVFETTTAFPQGNSSAGFATHCNRSNLCIQQRTEAIPEVRMEHECALITSSHHFSSSGVSGKQSMRGAISADALSSLLQLILYPKHSFW